MGLIKYSVVGCHKSGCPSSNLFWSA